MAGNTDISLCSQATLLLGEDVIEDFETGMGATCGALYATAVEGWLSAYPWTFCMVKAKLSRLNAQPTTQWQYAFQLPTDALTPDQAVFNSAALNARPIRDFQIMTDKLLCNYPEIWLDYTARPDESKWPPYFTAFAVNALAGLFAMPITNDKSMMELYTNIAFGPPSDNGKGGLFGIATLRDSQCNPSQIIVESPLIDARLS